MDVAFGRQAFGGRGELHVIRTADHDAVSGLDAGLHAHPVAIARADFDGAAREPFAAHLDEDIGTPGFEKYGRLRHGCPPYPSALVEKSSTGLADEQLPARVVHLELDGQRMKFRTIPSAA